uniref:Uncharacterized protein n=1 Tax=Euplotes harpa TaxID=151035 RepID=A0A7S3NB90_9SPIT|mmetsp:Transcript_32334/g.36868  ORF Transcript_32334/g.36868 Transcript_32334/m.36868 type:complete len:274 (+) Transcript_32334:434-1255(+)
MKESSARPARNKHRVCDRCDMKIENFNFINAYKNMLKAEDDVVTLQKLNTISIEKKIASAFNQELKAKQYTYEREDQRTKDKSEYENKINNSMEDLQFINKNKSLYIKTIQIEEEKIEELNRTLESLQSQKLMSAKHKAEVLTQIEDLEEQLILINPELEDFIKSLKTSESELLPSVDQNFEPKKKPWVADISMNSIETPRLVKIDNIPEEVEQEQSEEQKSPIIIDRDDDRRRIEKLYQLSKICEDMMIEERESEYYGSCISNKIFDDDYRR